jgi:hypothetical protein
VNVLPNGPQRVDPERFEEPEMRAALAVRDITTVYRLLQKIGFSQQRIAALTGQSQPEVSSIIHGRKVLAYDVLSRICDGLGAPRGYMGLAYDAAALGRTDSPGIDPQPSGGEASAGNGKGAVVHLPWTRRVE